MVALLIIQSPMFRSQSSSRSIRPMPSGSQRALRVEALIGSRSGSIAMNHSSTRRKIGCVPQHGQCGYEWV